MPQLPQVCPRCPHYRTCQRPCPAIHILADGNKSLRESLLSDNPDKYHNRDYKSALMDYQQARRLLITYTISDVQGIADYRVRLIAAGLQAQIPVDIIASTLHISRRHLYRLVMSHANNKLTPDNS